MRKILLLLLFSVSIVSAWASGVKQYGSVRMLHSDVGIEWSLSNLLYSKAEEKRVRSKISKKTKAEDVFGLGLIYGIKTNNIRAEFEMDFHQKIKDNRDYAFHIKSFLINGYYDINTSVRNLTVYVNLGLGLSRATGLSAGIGKGIDTKRDIRRSIANIVGLGVNYAINSNISVDFGYRRVSDVFIPEDTSPISENYGDIWYEKKVKPRAKEILLGMRYNFN